MLLQAVVIVCVLVPETSPVYLSAYSSQGTSQSKEQGKANHRASRNRHGSFKSDQDIMHYVKLFGTDMMIWKCKDAIQPYYDWKPIPMIELHCETIGVVKNAEWKHNHQVIDTKDDDHYSQRISAHYAHGQFYSGWLDFRLRIYNATTDDSGVYTFKVESGKGFHKQYDVYVDISIKKRKRGRYRKRGIRNRNGGTRNYNRFYLFHKHQRERKRKAAKGEHRLKAVKTGRSTYYTIK